MAENSALLEPAVSSSPQSSPELPAPRLSISVAATLASLELVSALLPALLPPLRVLDELLLTLLALLLARCRRPPLLPRWGFRLGRLLLISDTGVLALLSTPYSVEGELFDTTALFRLRQRSRYTSREC